MKIIITGGKGMLGRTLQRHLAQHELLIADLPELDILQYEKLEAEFIRFAPDAVIHCAAMTKVDDCETEPERAFRLNGMASANVAKAAAKCAARLIAISTDYVFYGERTEHTPFSPSSDDGYLESDMPLPQTVYGKSKLAGERSIIDLCPGSTIVRIAWLYGALGPSFVHTMAKLGMDAAAPALKVVDDQRGNPTSTDAVAELLKFLLAHPEVNGIVHGTCEGIASWYELTVELFRLLGCKRKVTPCTTAEYPRPAPRPAFSALAKGKLKAAGYTMPNWKTALAEFVSTEFKR